MVKRPQYNELPMMERELVEEKAKNAELRKQLDEAQKELNELNQKGSNRSDAARRANATRRTQRPAETESPIPQVEEEATFPPLAEPHSEE